MIAIFFGLLVAVLLLGAIVTCVWVGMVAWLEDWGPVLARIALTIGCLLAAVGLATVGISLMGGDDHAQHCAAGTRYTEQSQIVGKTVDTDWWCIPA